MTGTAKIRRTTTPAQIDAHGRRAEQLLERAATYRHQA